MTLTILEGSTFCICDDRGDVGEKTSGFYAHDTRFLSILRMTIDGKPPLLLSSSKVEYFSAAFYLRNPLSDGLPPDTLSIARRRFVGEGMQERIVVRNEGTEPVSFSLALEIGCDFADIMSVKEHDFALGDPLNAPPLPEPVEPRYDEENNQFVLVDPEGEARTQVLLSQRGTLNGSGIEYEVALDPKHTWDLQLDVVPLVNTAELAPLLVERRFGDELVHVRDALAAWQLRVPQLRSSWDDLARSFSQSVADLASLRMRSEADPGRGRLPAAGMPWFMTVFGRDTIITCLQTLLFGPSPGRSSTRSAPGRPRSTGSARTTGQSTRRRSTSSCSRRSGAGPATGR